MNFYFYLFVQCDEFIRHSIDEVITLQADIPSHAEVFR